MVVTLEKKGLIEKMPYQARSIRPLVPREELPDLAIDGKQEVGDQAGKYLDHKKLCESLKISFIMKMRPKHL